MIEHFFLINNNDLLKNDGGTKKYCYIQGKQFTIKSNTTIFLVLHINNSTLIIVKVYFQAS